MSRWTRAPPPRCSISTASRVSFDGFRALNKLSLAIEPGEMRAIIGPNGAGKTTMMDVVTGKTRPDTGDVFFDGSLRPHPARRDRDRPARHRPQVPEADRVRHPHGRGQSRARAQERPARAHDPVLARDRRGGEPHRQHPRDHPPVGAARTRRRHRCRTARSSGSRSACCWRRSRSCCWSTSRSPA